MGYLIAIVNNDYQVNLKGAKPFQEQSERMIIVNSLRDVDEVILSIDKDRSVSQTIKKIYNQHKNNKIIFANGGDQFKETILEKQMCDKLGIKIIDKLGEKIQSSSWLLNNRRIIN